MNDATRIFEHLRPRLQGIAYRTLDSATEAEEVVQEVCLRWCEAAQSKQDKAEAWLITITTRLCLDRLRELKQGSEQHVGMGLPEPLVTESSATPEQMLERADDVSVALLILLERLAPEARAAFLLREMLDADYDELAHTIGKSEDACRQMAQRARTQLRDERPCYAVE